MLADTPTITLLPHNIDQAIYQLILAKCGHIAMNSLESADHNSGYQAYIDLQRQCAQVNEELQQTAQQALISLRWHDNDTATLFLHKFRLALSKCQHLGIRFTEHQRVNLFFSIAQRLTRQSPYHIRIETLRAHRVLSPEPMTLADIETNLYGLDEETRNNTTPSNQRNYNQNESALFTRHNHNQSRRPFPPSNRNTSNMTCNYCHKPGHLASECRQKLRNTHPPTFHHSNQRHGHPTSRPPNRPFNTHHRQPNDARRTNNQSYNHTNQHQPTQYPPRDNRTPTRCFKCGETGHYANNCPQRRSTPPPTNRAMYTNHNNNYRHQRSDG
jgi:hypothetical protein